ncbi:transcription factor [Ganoderma sinense ZZ0214-1]|uniref:Transcription factor n=1 Tax=Ganoderma sinense ZZ0214-1 TaxID=1077348 RepID=A0A2G8SPG1_9APHY|nr:transcription factor [Ganoderma sinense ZZ0214-1]
MDTNASLERFYRSTANTSATLPSPAHPQNPQIRPGGSGSESPSDNDGSGSQGSYPLGHPQSAAGVSRQPYEVQHPPSFFPPRVEPAPATVYVDDSPYVPPGSSNTARAPTFVQSGPDGPFNPAIQHYDPNIHVSMAPTTLPTPPFRRHSGENSPTGSVGSVRSDQSGGGSGSSQRSASSGVVSNGSPPQSLAFQTHDVFPHRQRVGPPAGYNPEHYPAYDEHFRRVGMEHARIGTDPGIPDQAYYRPRTHTYPPVGVPSLPLGMPSPEPAHMSNFPSPEDRFLPMQSDEPSFDPGLRQDHVIPGQTRIYLPSPAAPQSQDTQAYASTSSSPLRSGDDAFIPTSDGDVRRILGLSPDQELSLNALADPPPGQRPGQSIPTLSQLAILGSTNKRLTLQEIYQALEDRFVWFAQNKDDKSWQNSIRHNLSLYKCFKRIQKPITEPGKGSYWVVDYSDGAGTKRPRKRNKRPTKAQLRAQAEAEAQGLQVQAQDDMESSPEEDEGFPSPPQSQDMLVDPTLMEHGHQVGQGRTSRSATRMARRGNSPYSQGTPTAAQGRHVRQQVANASVPMAHPAFPGPRQLAGTFNQPSFGQPSLGLPATGSAVFGQSSMGGLRPPASGWSVSQPYPGGQAYLPPPPPPSMGGNMGPTPTDPRATLSRAHTMPVPLGYQHNARNAPSFHPLPPIHGYEQTHDASGRFVSGRDMGAHAFQPIARSAPQQHPQEQFVQGSSRSGRRTSSSSESSHSRG